MGAGLRSKLALAPRAKKTLAIVLDLSLQQPGKVRRYRDLCFLQGKDVSMAPGTDVITNSLPKIITADFFLPPSFPPFIYQEFVVISPCALQHYKDSGHTEAKKMPIFQGVCGPREGPDKESNKYRAIANILLQELHLFIIDSWLL